jgi:hypothetical protein
VSLVEVGGDCVYTMEVVLSAYIDKKYIRKIKGLYVIFLIKAERSIKISRTQEIHKKNKRNIRR